MTRLAPHYIEEPPEGEPPHGYCPRCEYALVDEHECRCGWNEYEAIEDGAADRLTPLRDGSGVESGPLAGTASNLASPCFTATSRDAAGMKR